MATTSIPAKHLVGQLAFRTEGLPGAVLEAAAAEVPSVGFDVGGTGEAVQDGETGRCPRGRLSTRWWGR